MALALAVVFLAGYTLGGFGKGSVVTQTGVPSGQAGPSGGQQTGSSGQPTGGSGQPTAITSVHLESFPLGAQMGPGITGTATTIFNKNLSMGIAGESSLQSAKIAARIFSQDGTEVSDPVGWPGIDLQGSGGFSSCCINFPGEPGSYILQLYVDGVESVALDFSVVSA